LNSPEGWFKAQMLYQTLQRLPPEGSLQEWVLLMYLDRVESIEHSKFRALSQILLTIGADSQDSGVDAFEDYMRKAFPNVETKKKKKQEQMLEALKEWVGLGSLAVTPMAMPSIRGQSRMVSRISGIDRGAASAASSKVGWMRRK
jgi:hypothetical protein